MLKLRHNLPANKLPFGQTNPLPVCSVVAFTGGFSGLFLRGLFERIQSGQSLARRYLIGVNLLQFLFQQAGWRRGCVRGRGRSAEQINLAVL